MRHSAVSYRRQKPKVLAMFAMSVGTYTERTYRFGA